MRYMNFKPEKNYDQIVIYPYLSSQKKTLKNKKDEKKLMKKSTKARD